MIRHNIHGLEGNYKERCKIENIRLRYAEYAEKREFFENVLKIIQISYGLKCSLTKFYLERGDRVECGAGIGIMKWKSKVVKIAKEN